MKLTRDEASKMFGEEHIKKLEDIVERRGSLTASIKLKNNPHNIKVLSAHYYKPYESLDWFTDLDYFEAH